MKKILFVTYTYSLGGGAEKILSDIVNNLDAEKYEITILPYADYHVKTETTVDRITILPGIVDMKAEKKLSKYIKFVLVHIFPEILRKKYINGKYDVEISFNFQIPSFLVKETSKVKAIEWNHGDIYELQNKRFQRLLQKRSYSRATKIIAISQNTEKSIKDLFPQYSSKIKLLYNGININRILEMAEESVSIKLVDPAIVFLGRLEENKNPIALLEVIKELKKRKKLVNLYYLGQGELEKEIKEKANEWGIEERVFMLGYQQNPYPIIKQSRAVCMLSKSEGFPTVFTEGMVLGKPFITSNVGGALELSNTGKCGVIVNGVLECIEAIEKVVLDKERNVIMGKECQEYIKNYSMEKQIKEIEKLLDEK